MRPPITIWLYLSKEFLFSFFVSFLFFFFIFFVNQILLLAEEALLSNIPLWGMIQLIFYALPTVISLAAPFASLVGCLMAVGNLSSQHEIISLRATGFPISLTFIPFLTLGALISVFSFFVNDYLLPVGTYRFVNLYIDLFFSNPELELQPYSVKTYQDDIIITGDYVDGRFDSLFIVGPNENGDLRVIGAKGGELKSTSADTNVVSILLHDVEIHAPKRDIQEHYDHIQAEQLQYNFLFSDIASSSIRNPSPREMSSGDVLEKIQEKEAVLQSAEELYAREINREKATLGVTILHTKANTTSLESQYENYRDVNRGSPDDFSLRLYKIEYQKKYSIPFASLFFIFLSFPLGHFSVRSGKSVGFGLGLLISGIYWGILVTGQSFGTATSLVNPFIAMWTPNILVLIAGIIAFYRKLGK